jgi:hypothetical protein
MALRGRLAALIVLAALTGVAHAQDCVPPVPDEESPPKEAPVSPAPDPPPDAEPPKDKCDSFKLEDLAWRKGKISIVPFGVGIFNVNYNTRSLFQGSYVLYANPNNEFNRSQFEMSPQNTLLGVNFTGPDVGEAKTGGRIDFDFRGPNPVDTNATPYFFHFYGEIKTEYWRFAVGQDHDIVSPLDPPVVNFTIGPIGYVAGDIGFFRAQARLELYCPLNDDVQVNWQGSLNQQVIQALQTGTDIFGTDAGWPDIQGRLALALGPLEDKVRPLEIGVSAHIGERILEDVPDHLLRHYRSWSLNGDLQAKLTDSTKVIGEVFMGSVLGSYNGAIFQGIDPVRLTAIRAAGGWVSLEQKLCPTVLAHVGFGIDDANANDLSAGKRNVNLEYWSNVYWDITPELSWRLEVSFWETRFLAAPTNSAVRIETAVLYRF